jgi:hypothetical protein
MKIVLADTIVIFRIALAHKRVIIRIVLVHNRSDCQDSVDS